MATSATRADQRLWYYSAPAHHVQGDHSPGKPGKVREFQNGQGKVREKSGVVKSVEIQLFTQ